MGEMENNIDERTREKQSIRVQELKNLYSEITTKSTALFDLIDKENIYMAGHAVGGNSAVLAAHSLGKDKIRAVASFDGVNVEHPTRDPVESEIPLITMDTETFVSKYSELVNNRTDLEKERDVMHSMFTNRLNARFVSSGHGHLDFKDTGLQNPMMCKMFSKVMPPGKELISEHILVSNGLFLRFINEIETS